LLAELIKHEQRRLRRKYKQYKWGTRKKSTRALQTFDPKMMLNHP